MTKKTNEKAKAVKQQQQQEPAVPACISAMQSEIILKIHANVGGVPCTTREESIRAMRALMGERFEDTSAEENQDVHEKNQDVKEMNGNDNAEFKKEMTSKSSAGRYPQRTPLCNVHGKGPLLISDIPESARKPGVCVGIDEAGRGPVLGPMVYGAAFWNASFDQDASKIPPSFNDSKQLTDDVRSTLLEKLMAAKDIGWCARILHASEISRNMLRAGLPYNLNQMSHDAAMDMIQAIQDAGVPIQTCYIDTVGNPVTYKRKLETKFPNLEFVVESKADDNYATCSAASIVAKVLRDRMIETWQYTEPFHATSAASNSSSSGKSNMSDKNACGSPNLDFGSGYPSDPKCKAWMHDNLRDPVFGWPDLVRFSWGPAKKSLLNDERAALVEFEADDEEEDDELMMDAAAMAGRKRQQDQMSAFLNKGKKDRRLPYFERNHLKTVTNIF